MGSKLCIVGGYTTIIYSQNKLNCGIFGEHVELWGPIFKSRDSFLLENSSSGRLHRLQDILFFL